MSDAKDKHPPQDDNVVMTKDDFAKLMARIDKVETVSNEPANKIVAVTCNHCGKDVDPTKGACKDHPSEIVNHVAMGIDTESGLKRPRIARQTRA